MKKTITAFALILTLLLCLLSCGRMEKGYEALDKYILENPASDSGETLTLGSSTEKDGATYTRVAKRTDKLVSLSLTVSEDETVLYSFTLTMKKDSFNNYEWDYKSGEKHMYGNVNPENYKKGTYKLAYLGANGITGSADATSELAKSLCNCLLTYLDTDLKDAGLGAYELGFDDYKR